MYSKSMHCLTVAVGLEEGREVGVDVVGMDVGVELGVADGCKKTGVDIRAERSILLSRNITNKNSMHCLTVAVGLEEGREVGVDVVGMDVGVELGGKEGCADMIQVRG